MFKKRLNYHRLFFIFLFFAFTSFCLLFFQRKTVLAAKCDEDSDCRLYEAGGHYQEGWCLYDSCFFPFWCSDSDEEIDIYTSGYIDVVSNYPKKERSDDWCYGNEIHEYYCYTADIEGIAAGGVDAYNAFKNKTIVSSCSNTEDSIKNKKEWCSGASTKNESAIKCPSGYQCSDGACRKPLVATPTPTPIEWNGYEWESYSDAGCTLEEQGVIFQEGGGLIFQNGHGQCNKLKLSIPVKGDYRLEVKVEQIDVSGDGLNSGIGGISIFRDKKWSVLSLGFEKRAGNKAQEFDAITYSGSGWDGSAWGGRLDIHEPGSSGLRSSFKVNNPVILRLERIGSQTRFCYKVENGLFGIHGYRHALTLGSTSGDLDAFLYSDSRQGRPEVKVVFDNFSLTNSPDSFSCARNAYCDNGVCGCANDNFDAFTYLDCDNDIMTNGCETSASEGCSSPSPTPTACPFFFHGDANCDDKVNSLDFGFWRRSYQTDEGADFNDNGISDLPDCFICFDHYSHSF